MKTKIATCGESLVILLPKETATTLEWDSGDILDVEAANGALKLTRAMTEHDHAIEIARELMDEYRETLEALAKT
jgi:putative addiction module antidote